MGDILVFLTGQDDIEAAVRLLTEEAQNNGKPSSGTIFMGNVLASFCIVFIHRALLGDMF